MTNDVIIVGAGIIGAACARALASAGLGVTVIDRGTTAGGTSAACEGNLLVSDKAPGHELVLAQYAATATLNGTIATAPKYQIHEQSAP